MTLSGDTILMIGCGRMGGAIASALTVSRKVMAYDPGASSLPEGVERIGDLGAAVLPDTLTIVLAVKPQVFDELGPDLAALNRRGRLFVSIMAGLKLEGLGRALGASASVIRAMPNTPASIGHGITAVVANGSASAEERVRASAIIEATGGLIWLDTEDDMDAVTAISGSGPAYYFRFTEAFMKAGIAAGLSEEVAARLARQTFAGAARLAETSPLSLSALREQVTSPNGTTAAGLGVMNDGGRIDELAEAIVRAAADRSRALA